jgi:hypothetical protein
MSLNDPETDNQTIDPPENQGGGNVATSSDADAPESQAAPIDPPENQGGGN